ncbi:MAG TPA: phage major capsid protein [Pirellulales bacterium]
MADLQKLTDERVSLVKKAQAIHVRAKQENRDLTPEQNAEFDAIMTDVDNLGNKIKTLQDQLAKLAAVEAQLDAPLDEAASARGQRSLPVQLGGDGCTPRGIEQRTSRDSVERRAAFQKYLQHGEHALAHAEVRHLQASNNAAGGYLLPAEEFVPELIAALNIIAPFRNSATVIPLTTSVSLGAPTMTISDDDDEWTAEIGEAPEDITTVTGRRSMTPHPLRKQIFISNALLRQSGDRAEKVVREALAAKLGMAQEKAFMTGNGVNKPLGLFTASTQGISTGRDVVNSTSATVLAAETLIDAKYALKQPYQDSPTTRWVLHRSILKAVRKLKGSDGQFIWEASLKAGEPDTLLGVGIMQSEKAPSAMTASQYVAVIGDLSKYWIAESLAFVIQRLVEARATRGQTVFLAEAELDGAPVLEEAFARIQMNAS